jgi:hypothetical protein
MELMKVDKNQGRTEQGNIFGFVWPSKGKGIFFTWYPSLEQTLSSMEEDEMDHSPLLISWKRAEREIRKAWREEKIKGYQSLIPTDSKRFGREKD